MAKKAAKKTTKKKAAKKAAKKTITTAQRLGAIIKSSRQIMRKDKGLNGDLDRLPLLTWIMFLKFLDDMETASEQDAALGGKKYTFMVEAPYRWRDWASEDDGITGDELLKFISQDEATRPDGSKGKGLLAYLKGLKSPSGKGRQDVIANVFKGISNRMESGYLMRDVINKLDGIQFTSSEEMHTLSRLYENMLREMRDAAGDSGEFYTPKPVVQFMVDVTNPKLGETVLDPASGTGGFLVEAFKHFDKQVDSVKERKQLDSESIIGQEAKPLPYMLLQMNLLLHGVENPNIRYGNTLEQKISEIGDSERVDVILTNPPFGGEEEKGIQNNFPADKQTAETALLFMQYIMRKLRREANGNKAGRAAVVVPNGTLFALGVCARIKKDLLADFNLHTIVRLPEGTFAPYTDIPANVLFFERGGPTEDIWFYEVPLPDGRKKYSKTKPMQPEDMSPCKDWYQLEQREEGPQAWKIDFKTKRSTSLSIAEPHWQAAKAAASKASKLEREAKDLPKEKKEKITKLQGEAKKQREQQSTEQKLGNEAYWPIYNLDIKNPTSAEALEHRPPEELVKSVIAKEKEILKLMLEIESELTNLI